MIFQSTPSPASNLPIVIVGAGLGGLSAAIHLAQQGRRVIVFEKNERVGGKLNLWQSDGFTFDTGPSILTMPGVIRDMFAATNRDVTAYLDIVPIDPTCRYFWSDGTQFDAWRDLPRFIEEVTRINAADVSGFFGFLEHTSRVYDIVADKFLFHPFDGLSDLLTPDLVRRGWQIDSLRSVDAAVRHFFQSPYLRQVFNRYATYNGSSPYLLPATFNVIAYIEFAEGGWHIRGGMYELARALVRLADELGVEIYTEAEVARVCVEHNQACGVSLASGHNVDAAQVVVNADPRYAYQTLLAGHSPHIAARLRRLEPSCSGFVLLLGIDHVYEQLQHHNIFFSHDYPREFAAIFQKGVPPADPTVYVCATCVSDSQHAPPGHMNLFVLVNAPALNQRVDWQREAEGYRNIVVHQLERMGLHHLSKHIVYEQIMTPRDLQDRYNAAGGAIYGLASNKPFAAFFRPPLRARGIKSLYFVGGGTHPGGGIPLVLLSGRAVAEHIATDFPLIAPLVPAHEKP